MTSKAAASFNFRRLAVFNEYGVDSCCGGAATLREAALEAGVAVDQLLDALETAAAATANAS